MNRIKIYSGAWFDVLNHKPEEIKIEDIAHALSLTCRYGGHCPDLYTVAQHSLIVSEVCQSLGYDPLWGLMHDAAEAYIPDIPKPIKDSLDMGDLITVDTVLTSSIAKRFNLYPDYVPSFVKKVDDLVLAYEFTILMKDDSLLTSVFLKFTDHSYATYFKIEKDIIRPALMDLQHPRVVEASFINRFEELVQCK